MRQLQELMAVASAEMRSARRLVRTWAFVAIALVIGLATYGYNGAMYTAMSGYSPALGTLNPRFMLASQGYVILAALVVGLLFLAFDVRARDQRARMAEVLDARPCGNFTLLLGRLLGLVAIAWLPLALLVVVVQSFGALAVALDWPLGEPVEPVSILVLLLLDVPVMLVFWCAGTMFFAMALRNRLLALLAAGALLGGYVWLVGNSPLYLAPALALTANLGSDVLPPWPEAIALLPRLGLLLAAGGLLFLAGVVHPRLDDRPPVHGIGLGLALLLLGVASVGWVVLRVTDGAAAQERSLAAHEAERGSPKVDVRHVAGTVAIEPGEQLRLDLTYEVTAPTPAATRVVFSFNPGMTVTALAIDGATANFEHAHGLLAVQLPSPTPGEFSLAIAAQGRPDPTFGYLDGAVQLSRASTSTVLPLLGDRVSLFRSAYVALMPAAYWLPMSGAAVRQAGEADAGRDFFTVDLAVSAPPTWLVAGPGKREGTEGEFRFRPAVPLPEVALLGAAFERFAIDVQGVELELLVHPKHLRNVEFFADATVSIQARLEDLFEEAERLGIGYPYRGLSLVEVPAALRVFGGGWQMASVQSLPGVMLLREQGLPTVRFSASVIGEVPEPDDPERGIAPAKTEALGRFFHNDTFGGNPLYGAVRNLVGFQAGARGEGAAVLDFLVHELAVQLVTEHGGYFSAYDFETQAEFGALMTGAIVSAASGEGTDIGRRVHEQATDRPSVWSRALGAPLAQLDAASPRLAQRVLWLKVPRLANSMVDAYGRQRVGALLAELRRRHAGGNFTAADFTAAARAVDMDLDALLGDWLHDTALPGFVAAAPRVFRIADDDQGRPRYQLTVAVRNDEPVPGLLRLAYRGEEHAEATDSTVPIRIPGETSVELGLVASEPPERMWLSPYFSLNRGDIELKLPAVDETRVVAGDPFSGQRPSDWRRDVAGIVVDDLDAGFSVREEAASGGVAWLQLEADVDEGLPVYSMFPSTAWRRQQVDDGWGKYRRTTARVAPGDGTAVASFEAELPAAGRWRLAYHLPSPSFPRGAAFAAGGVRVTVQQQPAETLGSFDLRLVAEGIDQPVEFDGSAAEVGWNQLGEFDLPAGPVTLSVSNKTTGELVLADAVRWQPAATP